ncbi:MAG: arsenate reductase ArsC [Acidimicrobiia bacterium]
MTTDVIRQITDRIAPEYEQIFPRETTERIVVESLNTLTEQATVTAWLPTFAERFARDRLRALAKNEHLFDDERPAVLFLCVHNAGRSQMAAGLLRHLSGGAIAVFSGGSEPASEINPVAVQAMAEIGIDITNEFPKPWTNEVVGAVDVVVSMGCGDACPVLPGKRYVDWELEDPAGKPIDVVRRVRDEIGKRVGDLIAVLGVEPRSV